MQTLNLEKQAKKLDKILKEKKIPTTYPSTENGFLRVRHSNGGICYLTPDLEQNTGWGEFDFISIEDGFVRVALQNGKNLYLTHDLKRHKI